MIEETLRREETEDRWEWREVWEMERARTVRWSREEEEPLWWPPLL